MLRKEFRKLYRPFWIRFLMKWVDFRFNHNKNLDTHKLNYELIVSLTSYPARFKNLHLTLKCLMIQTVRADRVILWVAHEDKSKLPASVLRLEKFGLEIRTTEDIRSYKKLIPALKMFPNAGFVIVDDDLFYPRDLIENLLNTAEKFSGSAVAGRVHRVKRNDFGQILPYKKWCWNSNIQQSKDNFYTGCGGAFFPPNAFHPEVLNQTKFIELAPTADDVWFNWMLKLNHTPLVSTGREFVFWDWPDTQAVSLHKKNVSEHENDRQIANMIKQYGQCYYD